MVEDQDKLSDRQLKIIRTINDPEYFTTEVIDLICEHFHREWLQAFQNYRFTVLLAPRGHGKLQPLDSKILTPYGWTTMGEIEVGDEVIGFNGKSTKVTYLSPIKEELVYKIKTRDGRIAESHDEHLWTVQIPSNTGDKLVTKTLKEIFLNYKTDRYDKRNGKNYTEYRYFLPTVKPIEFTEKNYIIDPYTLGAWLGDGTSSGGGFTSDDEEILSYFPYTVTKHKEKYAYGILDMIDDLRALNLINNKHIPEQYLFGSIEQRQSLLQGLIDTDGHIQADGKRFEFSNKNKRLIDNTADLIRSLGGTATIGEHITGYTDSDKTFLSYRITGRVPDNIIPCRLKRKLDIWKSSIKTKSAITKIEFSRIAKCRCLKVDNEDGIYITNDYMPTHNTSIIASYILWRIIRNRNIRILIATINQDKANDMMSFIKTNLSENNKLIELFGEYRGFGEWSASKINVKGSTSKDPTLKVLGVGSRIISGHYDLIVLDDITDDENSRTEARRQALEDWYNGPLVGTFLSDTKVIDIGTRWNQDDIHNYLSKKSGYHLLKYEALLNPEEVQNGGDGKVLWPEHLPWDEKMVREMNLEEDHLTLKFIREHQGERYFQMQFQNNIIAAGVSKFQPEWVDKAIDKYKNLDGILPLDLKIYMGVDLGGNEKKSDYFSITSIGVDSNGDIYISDNIKLHKSLHGQIELIKSMDNKWHPSKIGMEASAQQKIITDDVIKDNPTLPIVPIKTSIINDRDMRTDRLSLLFETNRIYLNPNLDKLIDELYTYPRGRHDDAIDSLSFALQSSASGGFIDWSRTKDIISVRRSYNFSKL